MLSILSSRPSQLQGQSSNAGPTYNGPADVVRQLYKEGGIKSVFRGTGATLARDGPGSAAYFGAYEAIKRSLTPKGADASELNLLHVLTAGGLAGMAMVSARLGHLLTKHVQRQTD